MIVLQRDVTDVIKRNACQHCSHVTITHEVTVLLEESISRKSREQCPVSEVPVYIGPGYHLA